jgi:HSP20 family protein
MTTRGTAMAPAKYNREATVYDPFRELQRQFNRMFGEGFGLWPEVEENFSMKTWAPACDIYETDTEIVVKAELPEVKKENVKVSLEENVLVIRGERKLEEETKKENFHRVERSYGEFMRSFRVPNYVETTNINAEFQDGMLKVTMPKRPEIMPKQIDVTVK